MRETLELWEIDVPRSPYFPHDPALRVSGRFTPGTDETAIVSNIRPKV